MKTALITRTLGETRGVLIEKDWIAEFFLHRENAPSLKDAIFSGRVVEHDKAHQWAILDLGTTSGGDKIQGFLPVKGVYPPIGKRVLVQALDHGPAGDMDSLHKLIKLTTTIQLGAPLLIYTPFKTDITLTKSTPQAASLLPEILDALESTQFQGLIRQQALHVPLRHLTAQATLLVAKWHEIQSAFDTVEEAQLLYQPDPVARWLWGLKQLDNIVADMSLQEWTQRAKGLFPLTDIQVYKQAPSCFDETIEEAWDTLFDTTIQLPSGSRLSLHHTPAATVIDVDSGGNMGTQAEQLHFSVNIKAIEEILRQLRLRQLSGKILVDFISLKHPGFKKQLEQKLRAQCKADTIHFHGFTNLCMAELIRESRAMPLLPQLLKPQAPAPSAVTLAYQLLRHCQRQPLGKPLVLQAHPHVVKLLRSSLQAELLALEAERASSIQLEELAAAAPVTEFCLS